MPWHWKPFYLILLGLVVLAAALWWAGPRLGLITLEWRLVAILALLLLTVSFWLLLTLRAANRKHPPATSPEPRQPSWRESLQRQVRAAVGTLKTVRGRGALYDLPWILVLGPSEAGGSSAILHSGLTFPLPPPGRRTTPRLAAGISPPKAFSWMPPEGTSWSPPGSKAKPGSSRNRASGWVSSTPLRPSAPGAPWKASW